jgi:hypothetical protein
MEEAAQGTVDREVSFQTLADLKGEPATVSLRRFAELFGKNYIWAYRLAKGGKLKIIKGYGPVMVPKTEVLRIINEAKVN